MTPEYLPIPFCKNSDLAHIILKGLIELHIISGNIRESTEPCNIISSFLKVHHFSNLDLKAKHYNKVNAT